MSFGFIVFVVSALCHPVVPIRCSSWGIVSVRESFRYVYCFFRPAGDFISSASTLKLLLDCYIHFRIRFFPTISFFVKCLYRRSCNFISKLAGGFLFFVAFSNTGFYYAPHYLVLAILFDDKTSVYPQRHLMWTLDFSSGVYRVAKLIECVRGKNT